MAMTTQELEALQDSGEVRNFRAEWTLRGREPHSEGCRGIVEAVGFPKAPYAVRIRSLSGKIHRWDMRDLSVL